MPQSTVTIVTVCKNAGASIERALESVINCGYDNFEYVVIDGGSTDATTGIIERYRSHIHTYTHTHIRQRAR